MQRHLGEVIASQNKMLLERGAPPDESQNERIEQLYQRARRGDAAAPASAPFVSRRSSWITATPSPVPRRRRAASSEFLGGGLDVVADGRGSRSRVVPEPQPTMMVTARRFPWTWVAAALAAAVVLAAVFVYRRRAPHAPRASAPAGGRAPGWRRTPALAPVGGPRSAHANVVVVTIDTVRRDHLAPYGAPFETPAASRLAREGVVFEHAVSQVPLTLPSHSSIFTGLYPPHHTVRDNGGFVLGEDVDDARGALPGGGLPHRGVRVVVRAPLALGHRPGPRDLRRPRSTTRGSRAAR